MWTRSLAADPGPRWLTLDDHERRRAVRFRFGGSTRRFVVARGELRSILGAYAGLAAAEVALVYGPRGKPAPAPGCGPADLRFNLSHAGEVLILAVARMEVGVDVEAVRPGFDWRTLAGMVLAPAEIKALKALPARDRAAACLRRFTHKEAYVKALGDGLGIPLNSVVPGAVPMGAAPTTSAAKINGWWLQDIEPGLPDHVAALVTERPVRKLAYHRLAPLAPQADVQPLLGSGWPNADA